MKKYMLCIASIVTTGKILRKYIKPNNIKYCIKHNIEYIDFTEDIYPIRDSFIWVKTFKISELLKNLDEDDVLISIDADIAIFDQNVEFNLDRDKLPAYSIDTANTHNMGFHILRNNLFSRDLINELTSDVRYKKYINSDEIIYKNETQSMFWKQFADRFLVLNGGNIKTFR